jgi:hypothetical protein
MKQRQVRALLTSSDPFFFTERAKLVVLMAPGAMPTIFADAEQAEAGALSATAAAELMPPGKPATTWAES